MITTADLENANLNEDMNANEDERSEFVDVPDTTGATFEDDEADLTDEDESESDSPENATGRKRLKPEDYELYDGERLGTIGRSAAFLDRKGRLTPCVIAGYYYDGGWLVRTEKYGLSDRVETIYMPKEQD